MPELDSIVSTADEVCADTRTTLHGPAEPPAAHQNRTDTTFRLICSYRVGVRAVRPQIALGTMSAWLSVAYGQCGT